MAVKEKWKSQTCGECTFCKPKMGGYYCDSGDDKDDNYNWAVQKTDSACSGIHTI